MEHREPDPPRQTKDERIAELEAGLANQKSRVAELELALRNSEAAQQQTVDLLVEAKQEVADTKASFKVHVEKFLAELDG